MVVFMGLGLLSGEVKVVLLFWRITMLQNMLKLHRQEFRRALWEIVLDWENIIMDSQFIILMLLLKI